MQNTINENGRIGWIDCAKGILILLVVFNHIIGDSYVHRLISTFHMPAFFIISGLLFHANKISLWNYTKRKTFSLLIPYVFFELIGTFIHLVLYGYTPNLKGFIYNTLTLRCATGADWFLPTLFFAEILVFSLNLLTNNKAIHLVTAFFLLIIVVFFPSNQFFHVFGRILMATAFVEIGHSSKKIIIERKTNHFVFFLSGLITFVIPLVNGQVGMFALQLNNPLLFHLGSFSGSIFVYSISKWIVDKQLIQIGKNSLIVMGTHQPLIAMLKNIIPLSRNIIVLFIFVLLIEMPLTYLMKKTVPFLVGIKKKQTGDKVKCDKQFVKIR